MARNLDAKCKICKKYHQKLYLKGDRCYSDKCPISKQKEIRGQRRQISEYGRHLLEKQKTRLMFGLKERQMKNTFVKASRKKGLKGENFLKALSCRLDNVVFRLGLASGLAQARQIISHRFVKVNGKVCNIPSRTVKIGDEISLTEKGKKLDIVKKSLEHLESRSIPDWLSLDRANFSGKLSRELNSEDIVQLAIDHRLLVEFYSR